MFKLFYGDRSIKIGLIFFLNKGWQLTKISLVITRLIFVRLLKKETQLRKACWQCVYSSTILLQQYGANYYFF